MNERNDDERWRELLEPEAPRLRADAAVRLDEAVDAALAAPATRGRRQALGWAIAPAAALVVLLALLLRLGSTGEDPGQRFALLGDEDFVTALSDWEAADDAVTDLLAKDLDEYESNDWSEEDWAAFRRELESFDLADLGGN